MLTIYFLSGKILSKLTIHIDSNMNILTYLYHNIKGLCEDRNGSYHARDGLTRDVGLPTYRIT